ncbi:MAG: hypothetical protein Q4D98_11130 [Planctomycetia bacterium]|nr:hypothetical protein [Planctomycetia bacterium]
MRLTLRALLNWINQNLSAEDAALIAQKVSGSEFATNLKNQLLEVVKVQRLPAPPMLDGTPLGNPNTTAEYLDNVMSAEQTPDYEKFCLHSDVVLAEVASCHRILSSVLAQPIEVTPTIRAKMGSLFSLYYGIPDPLQLDTGTDLEQLSTDENAFTDVETAPQVSGGAVSAAWKYVLLAAGMVLLVLGGWFMGRSSQAPNAVTPQTVSQVPKVEETTETAEPAGDSESEISTPDVTATEEKAEEPKPEEKTGEPKPEEPKAGDVTAPAPATEEPAEDLDDNPEADDETADDAALEAEASALEAPEDEPETPKEGAGQAVIGEVTSPVGQILLTRSGSEDWNLLKQKVTENASYVSFETFQPVLSLMYEMKLQMKGASQLRLGRLEKTLPVTLEYGRFVLQTGDEEDMGKKITVLFSGLNGVRMTLAPETKLAVELSLVRMEGEDPAETPVVQANLYLVTGKIQVQNGVTTTPYLAEDPMLICLDSSRKQSPKGEDLSSLPVWIDNNSASAADRKNGAKIVAYLKKEMETKNLRICFHELTSDASREVQLLATRNLCQLMEPQSVEAFVGALRSKASTKVKRDSREELRTVIYRSSDHAKWVKREMDDDTLYQSLLD